MCQSSQLSGRVLPFLQSGRFSLPHIYKYITIYSFEENVAEPEGYDCSFHNAGKPENHSQKDKYQHPSVCDPLILYLSSSEKSRRHIWAYRLCDEAFSNTRHHLAYGGGGGGGHQDGSTRFLGITLIIHLSHILVFSSQSQIRKSCLRGPDRWRERDQPTYRRGASWQASRWFLRQNILQIIQ